MSRGDTLRPLPFSFSDIVCKRIVLRLDRCLMVFEDANQRPECRVVWVAPRDLCKPTCETDPQLILPRTAHPLSHPLHARNGPFRYLAEPLLLTGDCHNTVIANVRNCRCHPDICRAPVLVAHCEQYVGVSRSTLRCIGHQFVPLLSTPRRLREWPGRTPTHALASALAG